MQRKGMTTRRRGGRMVFIVWGRRGEGECKLPHHQRIHHPPPLPPAVKHDWTPHSAECNTKIGQSLVLVLKQEARWTGIMEESHRVQYYCGQRERGQVAQSMPQRGLCGYCEAATAAAPGRGADQSLRHLKEWRKKTHTKTEDQNRKTFFFFLTRTKTKK